MEEFEYKGRWWLPENPENKISGNLSFHPINGINLELIGSFKRYADLFRITPIDLILGTTSNGKDITLYNCVDRTSSFSSQGFLSTSFIADYVFIGHHFEKEKDIIFNNLSINYSYLEEWTGISCFEPIIESDESGVRLREIKCCLPNDIEVKVNDLKICISSAFKMGPIGRVIKEINLKQTTFIKMEPQKQTHFNDYQRNICYHIQNFLSLAVGRAVYPLIIKGRTNACEHDIMVYYAMKNLPDVSKRLHPIEMFFSFGNISDNFEKYLKN